MRHVIHRYYHPINCEENNEEVKDEKNYFMSLSNEYSVYKLIWTPDKIQYFIDDNLVHEVVDQNYEWFPYLPLRLILSQQVLQGYSALGQEVNPIAPQTSMYDYVKVKQFFLSPEISCPDVICSSATATLDVDSRATNITWQLSPTNLFTSANGSGSTANINLAGGNGQATITFTFQMPSGETYTKSKTFWSGLKASFSGPGSIPVNGSGTFTATTSCGTAPFTYQWWLREEGTGVAEVVVGYGNPLVLSTGSVFPKVLSGESEVAQSDPILRQPINSRRNYVLYLRVIDADNTTYTTNEWSFTAYGDVFSYLQYSMESNNLVQEPNLLLAPNPSSGQTTITLNTYATESMDATTEEWEVEVYDQGQSLKAKKTKLKGKETDLNTSNWKEGVYVVRVKYKGEVLTEKLVVK